MKFVILAVAMLALVACGLIRLEGETPHLDQIEGADEKAYISKYVECVNSRFPDPASGYRATTEDSVAREWLADRLDMDGMDATYSSLGCGTLRPTENTATEDTTGPHFPKQHDGVNVILEADLVGDLVLENRCLRVTSVNGTNFMLIWPAGSQLTTDGRGALQVLDNWGTSLLVGQEIRIGGGVLSGVRLRSWVEEPIPPDCPGPYWAVGEFSKVSPTATPRPVKGS